MYPYPQIVCILNEYARVSSGIHKCAQIYTNLTLSCVIFSRIKFSRLPYLDLFSFYVLCCPFFSITRYEVQEVKKIDNRGTFYQKQHSVLIFPKFILKFVNIKMFLDFPFFKLPNSSKLENYFPNGFYRFQMIALINFRMIHDCAIKTKGLKIDKIEANFKWSMYHIQYRLSTCFDLSHIFRHWSRWSGPDSGKYSEMLYDNGQSCWNGPNRSTRVVIKCGSENKVEAASEPSRCEYMFVFSSPAACSMNAEDASKEPDHDEL